MSYGGLGFEGGFCGSLGGGVAVAWDLKEGFDNSLGIRVTVAWGLKGFCGGSQPLVALGCVFHHGGLFGGLYYPFWKWRKRYDLERAGRGGRDM